MQASIVDLRYKMKDVLKALDKKERVSVLYRGKVKGIIVPVTQHRAMIRVQEHPFFGMHTSARQTVPDAMEALRGGRYR
jgi:hypothetical protein